MESIWWSMVACRLHLYIYVWYIFCWFFCCFFIYYAYITVLYHYFCVISLFTASLRASITLGISCYIYFLNNSLTFIGPLWKWLLKKNTLASIKLISVKSHHRISIKVHFYELQIGTKISFHRLLNFKYDAVIISFRMFISFHQLCPIQ